MYYDPYGSSESLSYSLNFSLLNDDKPSHRPLLYTFDSPLDTPVLSDGCYSPGSMYFSTPDLTDDLDLPSVTLTEALSSNWEGHIGIVGKKDSWATFVNTVPPEILASSSALKDTQEVASRTLPSISKRAAVSQPPRTIARASRARAPSIYSPTCSDREDSDSDEEYRPTPAPGSLKRRHPNVPSLDCRSDATNSPTASLALTSSGTAKRRRVSPPSRNKQSSAEVSSVIEDVVRNNAIEKTNFQCPECEWKQTNRRLPDFKRHLKTHIRPNASNHKQGFWCKGVPLDQSADFLIPPEAKPYNFGGEKWIGGCMRTFSRGDALKRHLDNPNMTCVSGHF